MKTCPSCEVKLTPRELEAGVCDICGASLVAIRVATPAGEDHGTRDRHTPEERVGWATTRAGLAAVILGIVSTLVAVALLGFVLVGYGNQSFSNFPVGVRFLLLVAAVFGCWGFGSQVTGVLLSTAVPAATGARKWAVATVFCTAGYLTMWLGLITLRVQPGRQGADSVPDELRGTETGLALSVLVLAFFTFVTWVLFLRRAAKALGNGGLAGGAVAFLIGVLAVGGLLGGLQGAGILRPGELAWGVAFGAAFALLATWHAALLATLRANVSRALLGE